MNNMFKAALCWAAMALGGCDTLPYGDTGDTSVPDCVDEVCNGVDDDCNGLIDEDDGVPGALCDAPDDTVLCFDTDNDGDGHLGGTPHTYIGTVCPTGTAPTGADCNDGNAGINPDATEVCNGVDDNCDGVTDTDASDRGQFYIDEDNDGRGRDIASPVMACTAPAGYVSNNRDCDDLEPLRHHDFVELCDEIDNDCDGMVDDGLECAGPGQVDCYFNADGDEYGRPGKYTFSGNVCPAGFLPVDSDCDDTPSPGYGASRYPGAYEVCGNGFDDDCDGTPDDGCPTGPVDADLDGSPLGVDCDDADPRRTPGKVETCGNGVDEDCLAATSDVCTPTCVPTGPEVCGNGVNEDCNSATSDTCPVCVVTGPELCGNGVNEDCNSATSDTCPPPPPPTRACYADRDNDGYGAGNAVQRTACLSTESEEAGDCEDGDALRFPELMEVQDLRDNDCDGMTDEDGLVTFRRYYRTPGVDWDHLFATSTPAGGYSQDDKWMKIYPVNICSGTYRPFDTCVVNGNGATVTLHGGNQLEALSQCRGLIGEDDITLLLLEGSGEYRDYSVRSGFSCSRLGYAMSQTGSARQSFGTLAKLLWRHRSSPFVDFGVGGRPGVADNMWSTLPLEGEVGHGGTSTDLDYDEHTAAFYVPYAR